MESESYGLLVEASIQATYGSKDGCTSLLTQFAQLFPKQSLNSFIYNVDEPLDAQVSDVLSSLMSALSPTGKIHLVIVNSLPTNGTKPFQIFPSTKQWEKRTNDFRVLLGCAWNDCRQQRKSRSMEAYICQIYPESNTELVTERVFNTLDLTSMMLPHSLFPRVLSNIALYILNIYQIQLVLPKQKQPQTMLVYWNDDSDLAMSADFLLKSLLVRRTIKLEVIEPIKNTAAFLLEAGKGVIQLKASDFQSVLHDHRIFCSDSGGVVTHIIFFEKDGWKVLKPLRQVISTKRTKPPTDEASQCTKKPKLEESLASNDSERIPYPSYLQVKPLEDSKQRFDNVPEPGTLFYWMSELYPAPKRPDFYGRIHGLNQEKARDRDDMAIG